MPKLGIHLIACLLLFLIFSSCRNQSINTNSQISDNPLAVAAYDSLIFSLDNPSPTSHAEIASLFNKSVLLLERAEQLLVYRKMGEYYYNQEIPDSALVYFQKGLEIAKSVKNPYYLSVFHLMCGSVYSFVSDFEPALVELKQAYSISLTLDSLRLQIRSARNLGNAYYHIGNYDMALDYYLISLEISNKASNNQGVASALNNIGNVYQEIKNYDRALDYYKQSEKIAQDNNYDRLIAVTNNNLGEVYSLKGQYDSALIYLEKSLEQVKKVNSRFDEGIFLGNLADLYIKVDSLGKAEKYFLESLRYADETGDKTGISLCNLGLADIQLRLKDPAKAEVFLKKGTEISEEIGSLKLMGYAYKLYSEFYLQMNDLRNSHLFLTRQMAVKDSVYSLENGENVAKLESQYREVQNARKIELLKEKQKGYFYLTLVIILASVIIFTLIFLAYRQKTKSNSLLQEKNLQIEASKKILEEKHQQLIYSQEKLNALNLGKDDFLTIISHDLKNPLSSIRGFTELLIRSYDSLSDEQRKTFLNEVFDSIERMSLLINNVLFWVRSQTESIKYKPVNFNLLKKVDENISIYKLMLAKKGVQLENNIPADISVFADSNVFDMIIRNLLSNALKFTPAEGKISLSCIKNEATVTLSVSDTGIGIPLDKLKLIFEQQEHYSTTGTSHEQGTGLGLGLVNKFIQQTGGKFQITSEPGKGSVMSFSLESSN